MRTIYRYELNVDDGLSYIDMPEGAKVLSISTERTDPYIEMWAGVDTNNPLVTRQFAVVGTGREIPISFIRFIGTVLIDKGEYVFHVFER